MKNNDALIIHFPIMLAELAPEDLGPLAGFLNPGLLEQADNYYTPDNLALDSAGAKTFLSQSIQYGEQFRKPTDMAYLGALKSEDFYSDTSMALRWQISTYGQENGKHDADKDYLKAQQLLILEYIVEEKIADLNSLSTNIEMVWKKFDSSLGIEREDEEFATLDRDSDFTIYSSSNWKKLLWAFALFLPQNAFLLLHDRQIADELEEAGVVWEKSEPEMYWKNFPLNGEILKGTLKAGHTKTYLGRIKHDMHFLLVNFS